jgi:hypothetical protein
MSRCRIRWYVVCRAAVVAQACRHLQVMPRVRRTRDNGINDGRPGPNSALFHMTTRSASVEKEFWKGKLKVFFGFLLVNRASSKTLEVWTFGRDNLHDRRPQLMQLMCTQSGEGEEGVTCRPVHVLHQRHSFRLTCDAVVSWNRGALLPSIQRLFRQ